MPFCSLRDSDSIHKRSHDNKMAALYTDHDGCFTQNSFHHFIYVCVSYLDIYSIKDFKGIKQGFVLSMIIAHSYCHVENTGLF